MADCSCDFPSTVWQSLDEMHLLISACEAWRWSGMQNLQMVVENSPPIWSRLWTKVYVVLRQCRRFLVRNAFTSLCISCIVPKIWPLKLPLSYEIVGKRCFLDPWFVGGRDTPHFRHAFSNRIYFRPCGQIWLSSVQRAPRVANE